MSHGCFGTVLAKKKPRKIPGRSSKTETAAGLQSCIGLSSFIEGQRYCLHVTCTGKEIVLFAIVILKISFVSSNVTKHLLSNVWKAGAIDTVFNGIRLAWQRTPEKEKVFSASKEYGLVSLESFRTEAHIVPKISKFLAVDNDVGE